MSEKKLKTRCYYTEYVNHMIRFYMTCPDKLNLDGKKRSDMENWMAVQTVLHLMPEKERERLFEIYRLNFCLPKAVDEYCEKTGANKMEVWKSITKTVSRIARQWGLI